MEDRHRMRELEGIIEILIELAGGEEIDDMDFDPYKPGRVALKMKVQNVD